jgi:site-specific DNA recombinase
VSKLIPAVGYVRCSTEMQEDSPDQQKNEILNYSTKNGYDIKAWYVDFGKSGTTFDQRPEFQRMKKIVENKPIFKAVICYDESRWGRAIDAEENTFWRVYFRKHGIDVVLVKTSIDPKHEYAPMLKAFEGVQASQYSKKLSELTLRGSLSNGIYSNGGFPPIGYKRVAVNVKTDAERDLKDGEWAVSGQEKVVWALAGEKEVNLVIYVFKQRSAGRSYYSIAQELNQKGIPSIERGRWKSKDQKWSKCSVSSILQNRSYLGERIYNKNSMSKIIAVQNGVNLNLETAYPHWIKNQQEWVITKNAHPSIITQELWEEVQLLRQTKRSIHPRWDSHKTEYLLSGLLICSECGYPFQGWSARKKEHRYFKYMDSGFKNKGICSKLVFNRDKLETFAIEKVKEVMLNPNILQRVEIYLNLLLKNQPHLEGSERRYRKKQLDELKVKIQNIVDAIESRPAGVKPETLLKRLEDLEEKEKVLLEQMNSKQQIANGTEEIQRAKQAIKDFVQHFEKYFDNASIYEKKLLLQKCIKTIIIDRKTQMIRFFMNQIPAVMPHVSEMLKKNSVLNGLSSECSGGGIRTLDLRIMIPTL